MMRFLVKPLLALISHDLRYVPLFFMMMILPLFAVYYLINGSDIIEDVESVVVNNHDFSNQQYTEQQKVFISKGDTLIKVLHNIGLPQDETSQIVKIAQNKALDKKLQIGQEIIFDYIDNQISKITFVIDNLNFIEIFKENGVFIAQDKSLPLQRVFAKTSASIDSSLIATLKSMGFSQQHVSQLINSYSYNIDFQRQIKQGDTVSVLAEKFVKEDGALVHYGQILYASLKLSGKDYNIYRYNYNDHHNYFSEDGSSIHKSLLKSPVKVVRISGHYGRRNKHPILGYSTMHKGVDFAAPTGTAIYAAGDGVIIYLGRRSSFGNFVQIKHTNGVVTSYAHASRFAKNLKTGMHVKQGQVIAYVGATGRATGPHLHYEVTINGKHVNPMSIKSIPDVKLKGTHLARFQEFKHNVKSIIAKNENDFSHQDIIHVGLLN